MTNYLPKEALAIIAAAAQLKCIVDDVELYYMPLTVQRNGQQLMFIGGEESKFSAVYITNAVGARYRVATSALPERNGLFIELRAKGMLTCPDDGDKFPAQLIEAYHRMPVLKRGVL